MPETRPEKTRILLLLILLVIVGPVSVTAQTDTIPVNKTRLYVVSFGGVAAYAVAQTALYFVWYKDNMSRPFHFVNDGNYWLQLDKAGHCTTAYTISNYGYWLLRWSHLPENKSIGYGALIGFGSMTVIEVLDGFANDYGASVYDLTANTLGVGLFAGQQLLWHEQRFRVKFSYYPTDYAQYSPDKLGENGFQRIIKDYNGQTYWLSANIHSFLKKESRFPSWINVAVGYGGDGMLAEVTNPEFDENGNPLPHFDRVRQYYVSMDIDWTKIKTNSKVLEFFLKGLSFIKLPFPTVEYNSKDKFVLHWIYF